MTWEGILGKAIMSSKSGEKQDKNGYRGRGVFGPAYIFEKHKIYNENTMEEEEVVVKSSFNPKKVTLLHQLKRKGFFPRRTEYK